MKKALFIVALYLVPFLSVKANIFEDGTVIKEGAKFTLQWNADCSAVQHTSKIGGEGTYVQHAAYAECAANAESDVLAYWKPLQNIAGAVGCSFDSSVDDIRIVVTLDCDGGFYDKEGSFNVSVSNVDEFSANSCPPEDPAKNSYTYPIKEGNTDIISYCADPVQISQVDSCNASSGNEYLTISVSSPTGCFPQPDGSICKYNAVDIGGGNQYYALDLEGDCYTDRDLPDLNGTPKDNPVGDNCVDYGGGVLGCPEDPSNVCSSGSAYAGGSINDCNEGCGMVNDQFLCIDNDTDGDGLPDYNDPDIDGDGIPNDDDLDSDGDGNDDPVNDGNGRGGSSIDLGPVVNELKKLNKQFESQGKPDDIDKDDKLKKKNDDYKTKLEELRDKGAEEMGYVDVLELDTSSSLVNATVPENTCRNFAFHPAGHAVTLDTCVVADKIRPILTWLIGILTAWHIFFLINKTLREGV